MRLKQIKLVGFKSFVDPTTVPFKSNLTAVVGPNGCGKSNIIDAVRWVMGESSAKHLRGESMSDVIFSGSDSRKPVGQASIELIFDNSDGTISGEYAGYNELAIKRLVTREGQSQYFLNGNSCRKKDVTTIFLGTGLGPRSYAIIEQGIISRLIEAKPDDLRVYIEEAAGVSKYKERRKETERRIRHTRDNLDRLNDIREELGRQLAHLQRQANSAAKYKKFKAQERQLKAELIALRWQGYNESLQSYEGSIQKMDVELASRQAEQQSIETLIEQARVNQGELSDEHNEVQSRFYGVAAEISTLEQRIKHNQERRQQLEQDLSRLNQSERAALEHITQDDVLLKQVTEEIQILEPELAEQNQLLESANKALELAESAMLDWQQDWDAYQQESASVNQKVEVLQTQIQHSELLIGRADKRLDYLKSERGAISIDPNQSSLSDKQDELKRTEQQASEDANKAEATGLSIRSIRNTRDEQQQKLQSLHNEIQTLEGREVRLTALQQASLATDNKQLQEWLEDNQMSTSTLTEHLKVESGWETAVETVLAGQLNALQLDKNQITSELLEKLKSSDQTFYLNTEIPKSDNSLAAKLDTDFPIPAWLAHVQLADSLEDAVRRLDKLKSYESIVSKDGVWLGAGWLRIQQKEEDTQGVLEREKELREIAEVLVSKRAEFEQADQDLNASRAEIKSVEQSWHEQQNIANSSNRKLAELNAEVTSLESKLAHDQGRFQNLNTEIDELLAQITSENDKLSDSRGQVEQTIEQMAAVTAQREQLQGRREQLRTELEQCRNAARSCKDKQHHVDMKLGSLRIKHTTTETGKERAESQLSELGQRKEELKSALAVEQTPTEDLEEKLQATLEKHQKVEKQVTEARHQLEVVEQSIRQHEAKRQQADRNTQDVRAGIETLRMEWQAVKVRRANEEEQLVALNQVAEELLEQLEEGSTQEEWLEKVEKIGNKIQRLGAINLAAIEEFDSQSERKIYMDQQIDDLNQALETLENAIKKIDKETTSRFRDTFEAVNKGLQELFPKVFGGGHAYLELTGDDLLSTGVSVMARPPGKRNSSISALSGGEKALTAIALVFAIFQMNPSPFCMLDEVDAPLDEANLGRFCRLVEEMSETVQFIYITHRKVTIEMAKHLSGVTMHEPGVSRMVSVDLDEATSLAEASQ